MKLTVIGSNSKGNCYALQSSTETLILEAGIRPASFKKTLNFNYRPVVGILASHIHGDHAKYLKEFSSRFCTPIYSTEDVVKQYGIPDYDEPLQEGSTYSIGQFKVTPFSVYHDVPCFGYLIYHKEMGTLLFVTDTFALPNVFTGVNHWLIEANYSDEILTEERNKGKLDEKQYKRILTSHLSLGNCIRNLEDGHAEQSKTITLVHLSARHSNPNEFQRIITERFGIPTYVATKGLEVSLDL